MLWLPSVGSPVGDCTAVTLLLVWGNGGSITLMVLLGIALARALCGGPTPIVVLCLDPRALGSILRNLGGGSHAPSALLGTAYASPGPARAQPGLAEEWGVGVEGSRACGVRWHQAVVASPLKLFCPLALWACQGGAALTYAFGVILPLSWTIGLVTHRVTEDNRKVTDNRGKRKINVRSSPWFLSRAPETPANS